MTPTELLALLGRAWSRWLLFPGGLSAFAVLWLLARAGRPAAAPAPTLEPLPWVGVLGALVAPWFGLTLLPLPPAPTLSRQTDVVVILGLLEAPLMLALARELRSPEPWRRAIGRQRLAAILNAYPLLILASLALALAAGSLEPAAMARPPASNAPTFAAPLHWVGAAAWALALVPALGLGPFAAESGARETAMGRDPIRLGLGLRQLGLVLLAALPPMAAFGALEEGGLRTWRGLTGWALSPLVIAALLAGFDRATRGRRTQPWAWACLALDTVLLLALLGAALVALRARLA